MVVIIPLTRPYRLGAENEEISPYFAIKTILITKKAHATEHSVAWALALSLDF